MSIVCFFLESQKTFEKREFISFYEFAKNSLVNDFYFETENNNKNEIYVILKEKDFGKFKCLFWFSEDVKIHNHFPKKALTHSLLELISFWLVILSIPIIVLVGIIITAYVKSNSIFELGIFLVIFLFCVFVINIICFVFQYRKILNNLNNRDD